MEITGQNPQTGWRPRGAELITVCETCGWVVAPDLDGCPRGNTFLDGSHPLTSYLRRDVADRYSREAAVKRKTEEMVLGSIEAAVACLDAAKAGLS